MKNRSPAPKPAWTIDHLVAALNDMRDAWTRASLEMRDIQFDLDVAQRHQAMERAGDLMNKVKPHE